MREDEYLDGICEPEYPKDNFSDLLHDELHMAFKSAPDEVIHRLVKVCIRALKSALAGAASGIPEAPAGQANKELLASVIAEIVSSPQPRLTAKCIDLVLGLNVDPTGPTQTAIAESEGVTRALASLVCVRLKNTLLGGKAPSGMRDAEIVEKFRQVAPRHRQQWESAGAFAAAFQRLAGTAAA